MFEADPQTARIVSEMLLDLEKNGMDAVRKYSGKFDEWNPENFELSDREIKKSSQACRNNWSATQIIARATSAALRKRS